MPRFSEKISDFLKNLAGTKVGKDPADTNIIIQPVAKSLASVRVGDVLIFKYADKKQRVAMVWKPPAYTSGRGNILLPCVKMDNLSGYTPESIRELYKNRDSLAEDSYRTYKWNPIFDLYKVIL